MMHKNTYTIEEQTYAHGDQVYVSKKSENWVEYRGCVGSVVGQETRGALDTCYFLIDLGPFLLSCRPVDLKPLGSERLVIDEHKYGVELLQID